MEHDSAYRDGRIIIAGIPSVTILVLSIFFNACSIYFVRTAKTLHSFFATILAYRSICEVCVSSAIIFFWICTLTVSIHKQAEQKLTLINCLVTAIATMQSTSCFAINLKETINNQIFGHLGIRPTAIDNEDVTRDFIRLLQIYGKTKNYCMVTKNAQSETNIRNIRFFLQVFTQNALLCVSVLTSMFYPNADDNEDHNYFGIYWYTSFLYNVSFFVNSITLFIFNSEVHRTVSRIFKRTQVTVTVKSITA